MTQQLRNIEVGMHYQCCGYIVEGGGVTPAPFEGWATFTQIVQQKPDKAMLAIGRRVPLVQTGATTVSSAPAPKGLFLVWDLRRLPKTTADDLLNAPAPVLTNPTEDGAVMLALIKYGQR